MNIVLNNLTVGIIGGGVVGSATARAWKEHVKDVIVWDTDPARRHNIPSNAVDPVKAMMMLCDIIFICLPEAEIPKFFGDIAKTMGRHVLPLVHLVIKSTVPIGTTKSISQKYKLDNLVHSPEFLTERTATWDASNPSRILIGYPDTSVDNNFLYLNMCQQRFPGVQTINASSEVTEAAKLICNAFHAAKVMLFNEFYSLAQGLGLDWGKLSQCVLSDGRIGTSHTVVPGPDGCYGFGGKCLPKDLDTLLDAYEEVGLVPYLLPTVKLANDRIRRSSSPCSPKERR